jgi:hypothetical protein
MVAGSTLKAYTLRVSDKQSTTTLIRYHVASSTARQVPYLLGCVQAAPHASRLLRRAPQVRRIAGHARLRRRHRLVLRRQRGRRASLWSQQGN